MTQRVQTEEAWLLHHRPYQDASRILEILSRNHGRLSLIARGSRAGKSRLKGFLRPFLPLYLSWAGRAEPATLTGAELRGAPMRLQGEGLMSAWYANELLMNLLHRHDPQPDIFDCYQTLIENLSGGRAVPQKLRGFEMDLLRLLGYGLNLYHDTESQEPLAPAGIYVYRPEQGPAPAGRPADRPAELATFSGSDLIAIRERDFANAETLRAAGRLLREVIAFHLGGRELKSRKVYRDMRRGGET